MTFHPLEFFVAAAVSFFCFFIPFNGLFAKKIKRDRMRATDEEKGITLQPGESAELEFDVPPEIAAALEAGRSVEVQQGEDRYVGDGCYERDIIVRVDGERRGCFRLRWKAADKT